jgi:hypothetical protein
VPVRGDSAAAGETGVAGATAGVYAGSLRGVGYIEFADETGAQMTVLVPKKLVFVP